MLIGTSKTMISYNMHGSHTVSLDKVLVLSLPIIALSLVSVLSYSTPAFASEFELANWYDKALSINQNNVPALVQKGTELLNHGDGPQAITWLDKALSIDPTNLMALVSKGAALKELGKYQEAIIIYDRVLTIDPSDVYALGGKADSLYSSGNYQQAVTLIDKALELDPSNGKTLQVKETLQQPIN